MKDRVKQYLKLNGITQREFCDAIGVVHSYLSSVNKDIPQKKLLKIRCAYPDLNIEWLITGQGNMLLETQQVDVVKIKEALSLEQLYEDNLRLAEEVGRLKAELSYAQKDDALPEDNVNVAGVG